MSPVLLVEDSVVTQSIVRAALKDVCELHVADCVAAAMEAVRNQRFDLILLDINLPDGDGFDVYARIRAIEYYKLTPILFLTARVDLEDKVRGFSLGADDYIVKPFEIVELKMRIAAKLNNLKARKTAHEITFGPFEVNVAAQKISVQEGEGSARKLELTSSQFKLLYHLLRNENKTISREEILKDVWGEEINVTDRTVDTHIYAIRRELGPMKKMIRSVHGKGYRFSQKASVKKDAA